MAFSLLSRLTRVQMSQHLMKRTLYTSSVHHHPPTYGVYPHDKADAYPTIGEREFVCCGRSGFPLYEDSIDYPIPSIRFKELNTPQLIALREKEKGDWSELSVQEKKELYRASYQCTFAEFTHPTGEWKNILAILIAYMTSSFVYLYFVHNFIQPDVESQTHEWQQARIVEDIKTHHAPIYGYSSMYNYEQKKWK